MTERSVHLPQRSCAVAESYAGFTPGISGAKRAGRLAVLRKGQRLNSGNRILPKSSAAIEFSDVGRAFACIVLRTQLLSTASIEDTTKLKLMRFGGHAPAIGFADTQCFSIFSGVRPERKPDRIPLRRRHRSTKIKAPSAAGINDIR